MAPHEATYDKKDNHSSEEAAKTMRKKISQIYTSDKGLVSLYKGQKKKLQENKQLNYGP